MPRTSQRLKPREYRPGKTNRYRNWNEYYDAILYRWRRLNSWGRRILDIRAALGWTQNNFCAITGFDSKLLRKLETGRKRKYHPRIETIKRIRLIEAAYSEEIQQYRSNRTQWFRLNGVALNNTHGYSLRPYRPKIILPRDPAYIEAMGGLAVFECLKRKREVQKAALRAVPASDSGGNKPASHRTQ